MTISMRDMLEAGVHFGHQTRFWNPKMAPYIYGHRNKIHIINLEKTQPLFDDAMKFIRQLASRRGTILMIGTKRQARDVIAMEAKRCGMPYVDQRWLGGMMTNFKTVKGSLERLRGMEKMEEDGTLFALTKREQVMIRRDRDKLLKSLGGIKGMSVPEARVLLRDLTEHATQPEFVYVHKWTLHDLVMWDNRQTMHRVRRYDQSQPRDMRRATVAGNAPTVAQQAAE